MDYSRVIEPGINKNEVQGKGAEKGRWITAACWHNCGGRCLNKVYVVNGAVLRQKTDDTHPDSPDNPQQRACARGRALRQQVFGPDRLKYPMKRKHWQPGGGQRELRGRDQWVRISWEEALDLVAGEIERIKKSYGNEAILAWGPEIARTLNLYGGHVAAWGSTSWGTWLDTGARFGVKDGYHADFINDRLDLRNSRLIVMWGANPAWSSGGNPTYNYLQAKRAGAKFIFIDPLYTDSIRVLGDEWIPIRPATDHALALGIAYTLVTEDDPQANPLIDWDFLNRCTIGFDERHMPPGADPRDNFKDYVLGTYDGQPKSPKWAAEICGVDPQRIRLLAREIGSTRRAALLTGWAPARVNNADSWPQMFMTLGCMTGHIGQPGRMTGLSVHYRAGNGGPPLVIPGSTGVEPIPNPLGHMRINHNELWDAVLTGRYTAGKDDKRQANIRLIYHGYHSRLNQLAGLNKGIEAHRKVEFVAAQNYVLSTNARYADIVLPVTTQWERPGALLIGNREILVFASQVVEPLYEARDDLWIAAEIGKRLGLDPSLIAPISLEQQIFNQVAGSVVMKEDGSGHEKLVTITPQDIAELGVAGEPQEGRITYKDFKEKGIYQVSRRPGDKLGHIAFEDYRKAPEQHPLNTESGRFEIYCRTIAEHVQACGWSSIAPIPKYIRYQEGYEDTFAKWPGREKGDFPLQLYTIHYPRRAHSCLDNAPWLREAFPQELYMNPSDAGERGIRQGDIVKITSRHGVVIRPVYLTERIMPGAVCLGEGAWVEPDEDENLDRAGSTNVLNGAIPTGQGHTGWNSCNVQVAKYDKPLKPDYQWPSRIIF
ncbi:MAG: molybdopterin-dependent oxidoreductase [Bacillota bacterium]